MSERCFPFWVVSHIAEGEVDVRSRTHYVARSGNVMVHPPHCSFRERAVGKGRHQWILLDAKHDQAAGLLGLATLPPYIRLVEPLLFEQYFHELFLHWQQPPSHQRDLQIMAMLLLLLRQILPDTAETPLLSHQSDQRFAAVRAYIAEHLQERITREQLAALVHLHPNHFDRVFRAQFGTPPMAMVRELRMERAAQLLAESDVAIDHVATICGLRDGTYLSRVFRARYGLAPGEYRRRVKSADGGYLSA
jgi:AraC-like DNA-binding protein